MNPAASIAQALIPHLDPAIAGLLGTLSLLVAMFALAGLGAWLYGLTAWGESA